MSSGSSGGSGQAGARPPTSFSVLAEVPLRHLPNNGRIAVQRQRGGYVPDDAVQFYLGWSWDAPNGGRAWKGGGSIQAGQVQAVIDALATALDKARKGPAASAEVRPADGAGDRPPPTYVALADVPLGHLPNGARFVVQRQRGGAIPDDIVQFYLGWSSVKPGGGSSWTGGGSVQAEQVPDLIDALATACESETGRRPTRGGGAPAGAEAEVGRSGTFADMCCEDGGEEAGTGGGGCGDKSGGGCVTFADALDDENGGG